MQIFVNWHKNTGATLISDTLSIKLPEIDPEDWGIGADIQTAANMVIFSKKQNTSFSKRFSIYTLFFYKNQEMSAEARMFLILSTFSQILTRPYPKYMLKMLHLA